MDFKSIWYYKWFDTPNNEDSLKKAVSLGKIAAKYGFILGAADVIVTDVQRTNLEKALRVGAWMLPLVGMSTAFTITQQLSIKMFPSMDQKFSFMFGGVAAAGVMGSWWKNGQMAFSGALIFGGSAFLYQYMREGREANKGTKWAEHFMFFPDKTDYILYERHQDSHWLTNTYDWRIHKQKQRGGEVANIG